MMCVCVCVYTVYDVCVCVCVCMYICNITHKIVDRIVIKSKLITVLNYKMPYLENNNNKNNNKLYKILLNFIKQKSILTIVRENLHKCGKIPPPKKKKDGKNGGEAYI